MSVSCSFVSFPTLLLAVYGAQQGLPAAQASNYQPGSLISKSSCEILTSFQWTNAWRRSGLGPGNLRHAAHAFES
mgnify:CR=1 FL=1|jgi:hypothetical protein